MTIEEIKSVSLTSYLSFCGYSAVRESNGKSWYLSPLHNERNPSFKVNKSLNLWYDYALGKGGNIINLAECLNPGMKMHDILSMLQNQIKDNNLQYDFHSSNSISYSVNHTIKKNTYNNPIEIIDIREIVNRNLLSYIKYRKIKTDIARKYCKEIHYKIVETQKEYYGICIQNESGGFEVRNKICKICIGRKDYTVIKNPINEKSAYCCIFEGFFDLMSFLSADKDNLCQKSFSDSADFIVLNSVLMIEKIQDRIEAYDKIYCYLDNDIAGENAVRILKTKYSEKIEDKSYLYKGYKDLNEYYMIE